MVVIVCDRRRFRDLGKTDQIRVASLHAEGGAFRKAREPGERQT